MCRYLPIRRTTPLPGHSIRNRVNTGPAREDGVGRKNATHDSRWEGHTGEAHPAILLVQGTSIVALHLQSLECEIRCGSNELCPVVWYFSYSLVCYSTPSVRVKWSHRSSVSRSYPSCLHLAMDRGPCRGPQNCQTEISGNQFSQLFLHPD